MSGLESEEYQRRIAGRSRTLLERVADPSAYEYGDPEAFEADGRLEEWEEQFPDESAFERRLEQLGVSREECRDALSVDQLADDEPLPEWIGQLGPLVEDVMAHGADGTWAEVEAESVDSGTETDERSFGEVSAAVAAAVRDRLSTEPAEAVLSEESILSMLDWFRLRFEDRFTRILFVEFKAFVAAHDRDLAFADPEEFDDRPTEYYEEFVAYLFSGGFADLCQEYPVFARLFVTQVRQFDEHLVEFAERLRRDRPRLREQFGVDEELGDVTALEPLADDTHGDGRSVMRVEFECGFEVVYKPRSVECGSGFYRLLDDLNGHLSLPDFRTPTYLCRDGYGWMEYVEYEECPDAEAAARYYERAGALACVAYFLEFTDCQFENLIVAGEHPILVDAETVMTPYVESDRLPIQTGVGAIRDGSVLLSLLLPYGIQDGQREGDDGGMMSEISGISVSSDETQVDRITNPVIQAVNTDVMSVEHVPVEIDRNENVPKVDGEDRPPAEHLDDILEGFETAYRTILEHHDQGGSGSLELVERFRGLENRKVYRPTTRYMDVIKSLCSRDCLHDGGSFGIELDQLAVPFCTDVTGDEPPWSLYDAERTALKRLDPPRIVCRTGETELRYDGERIGVDADTAGLDRSRTRLSSASVEDMNEQIELVRGCFGATPDPELRPDNDPGGRRVSVDDDRLVGEAQQLFDRVVQAGQRTRDGTYHWASVAPVPETDRLTIRPADGSLYVGRCGIGLLGGALFALTGENRYREVTLDALRPVREMIRGDGASEAPVGHGGTVGLGAVAYGLGTAGELLEEPALQREAARVPELVTDEFVEADDLYDVSGGAAGTALGLLGLHSRYEAPEALEAARTCGEHLLESRVETEAGVRVWETLEDCPPLTGFAHGVSGIAYALVRLWDETGDERFLDAALESLEFEAGKYEPEENNWPDERPWTARRHLDQWCYGRSGIGLARLGMDRYVDETVVNEGIRRAADGLSRSEIGPHDHVCCGEAGRASFMLELRDRDETWLRDAREHLGGVLDRKAEHGAYRTLDMASHVTNPTFYHGVAGIGYTLLRSAQPDELPCVLLWE